MNKKAHAGRIGGLTTAATHDMRATGQLGVDRRMARFESAVDPAGTLDPAERRRRADALMRAQMARLNMARWSKN